MMELVTANLPLLTASADGMRKLRTLLLDLAFKGIFSSSGEIGTKAGDAQCDPSDTKPFRLPQDWKWTTVGDQCELENGDRGSNYPNKSCLVPTGVPFINAGHLSAGRIVFSEMSYISRERFDLLSSGKVQDGDLLYCLRGSLGKTALVEGISEGAIASSLVIVRPGMAIASRFLLAYFSTSLVAEQISTFDNGTAQPNLAASSLRRFLLPLPPIEEQHRIVAKVDELMALCDRLEAEQADAEDAHARLVDALLASLTQARDAADFRASWQQLSEHFHTLFTTEASVDALKQVVSQLGVRGKLVPQRLDDGTAMTFLNSRGIKAQAHELPGWASVPLGNLGTVLGGATPSKANAAFWSGDIPWVSPKDMKRTFIADSKDHVSPEAIAGSALKLIPEGSILMVVRGMILAHSFPVALTEKPVTINQDMKALVPPEELARYLLLVLQSSKHDMVALVDRSSHGTCKLVSEKLWSHAVAVPPLAEQARIVAMVDKLLSLCDQLKVNLVRARHHHVCLASVLVEQTVA